MSKVTLRGTKGGAYYTGDKPASLPLQGDKSNQIVRFEKGHDMVKGVKLLDALVENLEMSHYEKITNDENEVHIFKLIPK